jgi:serine/threonine-protein kinase
MSAAAASSELGRGKLLGRYELLVEIGRGGMASVWVAREHREQGARLVAVKAMLPSLGKNLDFRSMFLDEGQLVRSIEHPNVVRVFEVGEAHGILFMAMEWVEGDSLREIIKEAKKRRPIPPEIAVRVIADTAAGLHAAHELVGWDGKLRNLVHCDVSPHNILMGTDGSVKLVDFGVASAIGHVTELWQGRIKGKYGYMAPEQARLEALDRRCDVFALGIVLFELTTGERLFRGRDPAHTVDLVLAGRIPRPSELVPDYPPKLEAIAMRALRREREQRYQTAEEFRAALEQYLREERVLVPPGGVSGLLKRVLGERIQQRRDAVRAALASLDGKAPPSGSVAVLPRMSAEEASRITVSELAPQSSSRAELSSPTASQIGVAQLVAPPSDPSPSGVSQLRPVEAMPPAAALPAELVSRPARRAGFLSGFALGVAVGALGALVIPLAVARIAKKSEVAASQPSQVQPGAAQKQAEKRATDQGMSIDSLPAEGEAAARRKAGVAVEKVSLGDEERTEKPGSRDRRSKAEKVELTDSPDAPEPPPKEEPPPSGERPPLNRGAAMAALNSAAGSAASCKQSGGPSGSGTATVTFSPSGSASSVSIGGKFSGTGVGSCVAGVFRRARVPAFSGGSVTLSRGFRIP